MIVFALKSAITLALLYSCFFLFLSKETFHHFNRVMLIIMMVASLVVPFIHLNTEHPTIVNNQLYKVEKTFQAQYPNEPVISKAKPVDIEEGYDWIDILVLIYYLGFIVMICVTVVQLVMIVREIQGGLRHKDEQGNTIILKPGKFAPFSFFNYVVMSVDDYEHNRQSILTHEQEHVRLLHSWDNLLVTILKVIQWFNPFIYLLSLDLDAVHEFEADEAVLYRGVDTLTYQQLLVSKAIGRQFPTFANGLNRSSLKRRIIMMCQSPSSHWLMLKAIIAIPVVVLALSAFASPKVPEPIAHTLDMVNPELKNTVQAIKNVVIHNNDEANIDKQNIESLKELEAKEKKLSEVEEMQDKQASKERASDKYYMPAYCPYDFRQYITKNMQVPEYARENHINAKVILHFTVKADGSIDDIRVDSPTHPLIDQEAIRLISEMPKWKPATVNGKVLGDTKVSEMVIFVTNNYTD